MRLQVLPSRTAGAAENMALDFLLLKRCPGDAPRFRHYDWRKPAVTFGYSQKLAEVRPHLEAFGGGIDLCRRPTGGGIVDHRDDWTYALVIPRGHPLEEARAADSYRVVHEALAGALRDQNVAARLQGPASEGRSGLCFARAEPADVVNGQTAAKIAGAAQKRSRQGILFQGSIAKAAAGAIDWDRFLPDFSRRIAGVLGVGHEEAPWPDLDESECEGLTETYASAEWLGQR